jgi:hypothetical protein
LSAPALRKKKGGAVYTRFPDIEAKLDELYRLSDKQLVTRCELPKSDPNGVPTQCVVHFLRQHRDNPRVFTPLYRILATRARQVRPTKLLPKHEQPAHETAFDEFALLLVKEQEGYQERLDFFEVDFKGAYALLILDAQRRHDSLGAKQSAPHSESDHPGEDPEPEADLPADPYDDPVFKGREAASIWGIALERMTLRQRKIVKMCRQGFLIESNDSEEATISKLLGITPKTARKDRNIARAIFEQLIEEGVNA